MVPLSGLDICQYNILLLGAVGAGKSSFINTLSTVFTGKVEPIAQFRQSVSSVTTKLKKYDLRSANDDTLKLRIFDIRGFESKRENDKELELLIDGRIPENYQFPDTVNPDDIKERPNPTFNDKIHLICFVEGNSDYEKLSTDLKERLLRINQVICNTGYMLHE
ncbi:interferon-induced protein 44-like [Ruditapes philippinarum]|uniref:interferon-induced protein 44-like n=1 Tax=Ruditapes philippinarum TaxID=129788 RepID=UPI00295A8A6E|nr:interferon-induced protein 44-like [Ruditapes philippinarum]